MDTETADRLVALNYRFYQSFAAPFSETRLRLQPGVTRLLEEIPLDARILDLGCGGGALAGVLAQRGQTGPYLGLDFSEELLEAAQISVELLEASKSLAGEYAFKQVDLTDPTWAETLRPEPFDCILAFAILHHIPGTELRARLLTQIHKYLAPNGNLLLSNWQFLNSERLRDRIQPWERAGISADNVDAGDALLDWRRGGEGLRYAHQFTEAELAALAKETDFSIHDTFYADGEGGNLGLYQVWGPR